jgi:hypothetical protein
MKMPTVPANKLKKTNKKLTLQADTLRRLSAGPAQKGRGAAFPTIGSCTSCTGGTLHICC